MAPSERNVPFVDLTRQFNALESELVSAFLGVGRSGNYILGDVVQRFELELARYCGVEHVVSVANGSDALFLILKALGVGPGDEVITAANSFIASAWVIVATGATPVLVDVREDLNIDPRSIEKAITSRTKAIIPVHLAGRIADMNAILEIAGRANVCVVEDAAQAIGARYNDRPAGSLGTAAGFSLHPLKNLGVYGDGGFVSTNDHALAENIRLLRNHGLRTRDQCVVWGYNSRLDAMQAAFGLVKLQRLDSWNARCREIARFYRVALCDYVGVPEDKAYEQNVYHNFIVKTPFRDELARFLAENGVGTAVHYPVPIHLQPVAQQLGYLWGSLPVVERLSGTILSLPIYPELTDDEIRFVAETVKRFFVNKY